MASTASTKKSKTECSVAADLYAGLFLSFLIMNKPVVRYRRFAWIVSFLYCYTAIKEN